MNAHQRRVARRAGHRRDAAWAPFWRWRCEVCAPDGSGDACSDKRLVERVQRAHDKGRHDVTIASLMGVER